MYMCVCVYVHVCVCMYMCAHVCACVTVVTYWIRNLVLSWVEVSSWWIFSSTESRIRNLCTVVGLCVGERDSERERERCR